MPRRIHLVLSTWLLVAAVGGPWPILQSVAWVKMLVTFSRTDSFSSAFAKTFNGKNQCNLCRFVAKGKKADQKEAAQIAKAKIDFFLVSNPEYPFQVNALASTTFISKSLSSPSYSPPRPPPRFA